MCAGIVQGRIPLYDIGWSGHRCSSDVGTMAKGARARKIDPLPRPFRFGDSGAREAHPFMSTIVFKEIV